jgi:NAD(P)-dependent dehydrogenase (short-subunit alcohol dehydrogenase family)
MSLGEGVVRVDSLLAGRGYILVGGTAGIGLAAAEVLASQGANVVLVGRNRERADAAAESLSSKYGVSAVAVPGDATMSQTEVDRFIEEAVGTLDLSRDSPLRQAQGPSIGDVRSNRCRMPHGLHHSRTC